MKYLLLLLATLLVGCATTAAPRGANVKWDFNSANKGTMYLVANGQRHVVSTKASTPHQELKRSEYADYRIPAGARAAAYSWHAGFGDVVWVVQKGKQLEVYQQEMDESETSRYPVKRILVVPL